MTTPSLPARIALGFRRDRKLSFTGVGENRTLTQCEATVAIRELLEDIYDDATPCDGTNIVKPDLGNHFRIRWLTKSSRVLRFYLSTKGKLRPKYEVHCDIRTIRLRKMIQSAYDMAGDVGQRAVGVAGAVLDAEAEADAALASMGLEPTP